MKQFRKIGLTACLSCFEIFSGHSLHLDPFYELPCFFCLTFGTNITVMSASHFFENWQLGHQSVLNGC